MIDIRKVSCSKKFRFMYCRYECKRISMDTQHNWSIRLQNKKIIRIKWIIGLHSHRISESDCMCVSRISLHSIASSQKEDAALRIFKYIPLHLNFHQHSRSATTFTLNFRLDNCLLVIKMKIKDKISNESIQYTECCCAKAWKNIIKPRRMERNNRAANAERK